MHVSSGAADASAPPISELPTATNGQEGSTPPTTGGQQDQESQAGEGQEGEKGSEEKTSVQEEKKEGAEEAVEDTSSRQDTPQPAEGEGEKEKGGVATEEGQEMDTMSVDANASCPEGQAGRSLLLTTQYLTKILLLVDFYCRGWRGRTCYHGNRG